VEEYEEVGEMNTLLTSDLTTENIVISNPIETMNNNSTGSPGNRVSDSCDTIISEGASVNASLKERAAEETEEVELNRLQPDTEVKRQSKLGSLWMSVKKWAKKIKKDVAFFM